MEGAGSRVALLGWMALVGLGVLDCMLLQAFGTRTEDDALDRSSPIPVMGRVRPESPRVLTGPVRPAPDPSGPLEVVYPVAPIPGNPYRIQAVLSPAWPAAFPGLTSGSPVMVETIDLDGRAVGRVVGTRRRPLAWVPDAVHWARLILAVPLGTLTVGLLAPRRPARSPLVRIGVFFALLAVTVGVGLPRRELADDLALALETDRALGWWGGAPRPIFLAKGVVTSATAVRLCVQQPWPGRWAGCQWGWWGGVAVGDDIPLERVDVVGSSLSDLELEVARVAFVPRWPAALAIAGSVTVLALPALIACGALASTGASRGIAALAGAGAARAHPLR